MVAVARVDPSRRARVERPTARRALHRGCLIQQQDLADRMDHEASTSDPVATGRATSKGHRLQIALMVRRLAIDHHNRIVRRILMGLGAQAGHCMKTVHLLQTVPGARMGPGISMVRNPTGHRIQMGDGVLMAHHVRMALQTSMDLRPPRVHRQSGMSNSGRNLAATVSGRTATSRRTVGEQGRQVMALGRRAGTVRHPADRAPMDRTVVHRMALASADRTVTDTIPTSGRSSASWKCLRPSSAKSGSR